jgi:hypothetical protein
MMEFLTRWLSEKEIDERESGMSDDAAIALGMTHKHYKGGYFKFLCEAHDSSDPKRIHIVYQSVRGTVWVRSKEEFDALIPGAGLGGRNIPRFRSLRREN